MPSAIFPVSRSLGRFLPQLFCATVLFFGSGARTPAEEAVASGDAFAAALKKAIKEKDEKTLLSYVSAEGLSEAGKARQAESFRSLLAGPDVYDVTLGPLPVDFPPFFIMNGKRYEPTDPPAGIVTVSLKQENGLTSTQLVYAIVGGKYRLVTTRVVPIDWKGPRDVRLGYVLRGQGAESAVTRVRFNASGVDLDRTYHGPATDFWGQRIDGIEVTVSDPRAAVQLTVMADGKEIFKSEPQEGPGTISYAPKNPEAPK